MPVSRTSATSGVVLMALGCLAVGCARPDSGISPAQIQQVSEFLTGLERDGSLNGVVLIADRGEVLYQHAHGLADFATGDPLSVDALFEVGSISKTFTAVAIHMLAARGELSLEDPLAKFFPLLPYGDVTVGRLLSHTSGLVDVYGDVDLRRSFYAFYGRSDRPYSNADYLSFMEQNPPPPVAAPGAQDHYSNTGYVLLALIVEQVSGQRFDEFLQRNIFEPAGMHHTFVHSLVDDLHVPHLVNGYRRDSLGSVRRVSLDPDAPPSLYGLTYGDDEIVTTAGDLLAYDRALSDGRLLSSESLHRIFTPASLNDGRNAHYGQGFAVSVEDGVRYVSHGGSNAGFLAYCTFSTADNENTIVVLTNVTERGSGFRELHGALRRILRGDGSPLP